MIHEIDLVVLQRAHNTLDLELNPHARSDTLRRGPADETALQSVVTNSDAIIQEREQADPLLAPHLAREQASHIQRG